MSENRNSEQTKSNIMEAIQQVESVSNIINTNQDQQIQEPENEQTLSEKFACLQLSYPTIFTQDTRLFTYIRFLDNQIKELQEQSN